VTEPVEAPVPRPEDASLAGRVVVVTGAANGIGRATAQAAAAFGADLAVVDRDPALEDLVVALRSGGTRVVPAVADVRDPDGVAAFADAVAAEFGSVQGLVNNAGGTFRSDLLDVSAGGVAALVAENFTSVLDVTRAFVPHMTAGGSVVNVTSSEAFQAAPGFAVYSSMKAAVEQLSRTLALELADHGVRVNCVAPDGMPTTGDAALAAEVAEVSRFRPPPVPPVGRFAAPEACASVVVFLLGDLAGFVTGASIAVDGGLRAAGGWHRSVPPAPI
jgi:NAD(P)-dependent dehydrogenase (short-subunit alcohol dehydrogenase family)